MSEIPVGHNHSVSVSSTVLVIGVIAYAVALVASVVLA